MDYNLVTIPDYIIKTQRTIIGHPEYKLNNLAQYMYIQLPKFRNSNPDMSNLLNQWLSFIDMEREDLLEMATKNNVLLKQAKTCYDNLTDEELKRLEDFEFIRSLDEASALAFAKSESFAEGETKGFAKANTKVARKLLSMNMPIEKIASITELTIDEIKKLQDDNKNTDLNK